MSIKCVLVDSQGTIVKSPSPKLPADIPNKPATSIRVVKLIPERTRTNRSNQAPNGHWIFDEPLGQAGEFGFIYLIHDTCNDMMYIGKKQFRGSGKLNKGVESNWKWYTSSCKALQEAIKTYGKEMFKFYVIEQYKIRGTLGYAETWSLMHCETPAKRNRWYNSLVNKISWPVKENISEKHRKRLHAISTHQLHLLTPYVSDSLAKQQESL